MILLIPCCPPRVEPRKGFVWAGAAAAPTSPWYTVDTSRQHSSNLCCAGRSWSRDELLERGSSPRSLSVRKTRSRRVSSLLRFRVLACDGNTTVEGESGMAPCQDRGSSGRLLRPESAGKSEESSLPNLSELPAQVNYFVYSFLTKIG